MITELRSRLEMKERQVNNDHRYPTLTRFSQKNDHGRKLYLLPGIVPEVSRAYRQQIEHYLSVSQLNLVGVNYPSQGFDINKIAKVLESDIKVGESVVIVASSFGGRVIIDVLQQNPHLADRVKSLILFGPFMYLDRKKSRLSTLGSVRANMPMAGLSFVERPLVRAARSRFNYDPRFYASPSDRKKMIEETKLGCLGARMVYFVNKPDMTQQIAVPTTLAWWDKEPASVEQRQAITELFPNQNTRFLPGHHGYLQTEAAAVIGILDEVLGV